jgi:CheY-like chemotaxis protein
VKAILVVDDDPEVGEALAIYLTAEGYRTQIATNGREALAAMREEGFVPDLVVTDIVMPEMDGTALMVEMKRDARLEKIPVLLMTGAPAFARDAPRDAPIVLHKPIGLEAMLGVIDQLIGR